MVWMPWFLFHTTASRACMFSWVPITGGAATSHTPFNAFHAAVSFKSVCDQRRHEKQGGKVQLNRTHLKMIFLTYMQLRYWSWNRKKFGELFQIGTKPVRLNYLLNECGWTLVSSFSPVMLDQVLGPTELLLCRIHASGWSWWLGAWISKWLAHQ